MKKITIIGSGIGGLVAGNLLARKGHDVIIFESHNQPGGYISGFRRNGFYFESGTLSFESSKMIFNTMKELGVFDRIDFVRQHSRWASEKFDGVATTYQDFQNLFLTGYPEHKDELSRYFAEVTRMYNIFRGFGAKTSSGVQRMKKLIITSYKAFQIYRKYARINTGQFAERYFEKGSELYRIFRNIGYPDMSAWLMGGAILTLFDDYWTVRGGMQSWADVLADSFQQHGGELKLRSNVEKIITRDGAAVGVICKDEIYDADVVISAGDYKKTFLNLLDNPSLVPDKMLEKIRKNAVSEGFFTVYLGLNLSFNKMKKIMQVPHVMFIDEKPGADVHDPYDTDYFEKTSVFMYSPSLLNPELAPAAKSSLMIQAMAPTEWLDNWQHTERDKYLALKEKVKQTLIRKVTTILPELPQWIEFSDAATPLTYERYTHNTNGATSAWSWNPANKFHKNIIHTFVDTPVKNLLIGSCWASQIGGVPGAIGAAKKCVNKIDS